MPGAAWWIEDLSGPVDRGALGWAAIEPERCPLSADVPFDLASLTKPLCTALVLALLEGQRRVDPGCPVGDIVEEMRGSTFERVSLLDLATHAAGFRAWAPLYLEGGGRAGYIEQIAREVPAVAPGTELYSDLGYLLLGFALERVSGRSLDELFRREVAAPLGLPRIGFARSPKEFDDAAATERGNEYERRMAGTAGSGHQWRRRVLRGSVHDANAYGLGGVAGHAGLFGTVAEVVAVGREILRPSRLALPATARRRLLLPSSPESTRTVGLVTADGSRASRGILPRAAVGHTGFTGTSLWLDPDRQRVFVLLTNRVHPVVPHCDFQPVRRGFHRAAVRQLVSSSDA
jgi:CubicO group peptidase (beta-lactamase class C family)